MFRVSNKDTRTTPLAKKKTKKNTKKQKKTVLTKLRNYQSKLAKWYAVNGRSLKGLNKSLDSLKK